MQSRRHLLAIFIALLMILSALSGLLDANNSFESGASASQSGSSEHSDNSQVNPFQNGSGLPPIYNVTFTETGLKSGKSWSVTFNGSSQSSSSTSILFQAANGTYSYTIGPVAGYITTYSGSVTVSGADAPVSVIFSAFTYSVTFAENGLKSGTSWSVTLNGDTKSAVSGPISYQMPNGTYDFTISPVAGYSASTYGSSLNVSGSPADITITWLPLQVNYTIAFQAPNLPAGTQWSVTLASKTETLASTTISFQEPNGSYAYSISGATGYKITPSSGTASVNGADVTITVSFTQQIYNVTFSETGLDTGTSWTVTFNGNSQTLSSPSISFTSADGSYAYSVGSVFGYTVSPSFGSASVSGSDVNIAITFTKTQYSVTFNPTGLTAMSWSVTLNQHTQSSSSGGSIVFSEYVGNYSFSVGSILGYLASPASGTITVKGDNVSQTISWTAVSYTVSFTETGLPSGASWIITFNNVMHSASSSIIYFNANDGSYSYSIDPIPGYTVNKQSGTVTVSGSNQNVNVQWTGIPYNVTFTESGLSSDKSWSVSLDGSLLSSNGNSITFIETPGTYAFTVNPISGYHASQYSGSVTVVSSDVPVSITWTQVDYTITFTESGLDPNTQWTVTLSNGDHGSSNTSIIQLSEPNGSYTFTASAIGYDWLAPSGSFAVLGINVMQSVSFTAATYVVTFTENGLPSGQMWSITVGTSTTTLNTNTITFNLPDGSYNYYVGTISGYHANSYSGSFTVDGKKIPVITIKWTQVTYSITFTESGLPTKTTWSVTFDGTPRNANTPSDIVFTGYPNGTYAYSIGQIDNYQSSVTSSTVIVDGNNALVNVTFSEDTYSITFTETGLQTGIPWTVNLSGTSRVLTQTSQYSTIQFNVPTGSYSYVIGQIYGYQTLPPSGNINVANQAQNINITWKLIETSVTFTEKGLVSGTSWGISINGAIKNSTSSSIGFSLPEGQYSFSVLSVVGYQILDYNSTFTVSTQPVSIQISFRELYYNVTFVETGLNPGMSWSVTFGGAQKSSNTSEITFTVLDGTYNFWIGKIQNYHASQYSGSVTVYGSDRSIAINWTLEVYSIVFTEVGLPLGMPWGISINGEVNYYYTSSVTIEKENGTYKYEIVPTTEYSISPSNGTILINGTGVNVHITFTRVYPVSFSETGLNQGIYWSVFIGNNVTSENISKSTQGTSITFYLPNGVYFYHIGPISGYYPDKVSGIVLVSNSSSEPVLIVFTQVFYMITFVQHGYPNGLEWIPTLNDVWYPTTTPYLNLSVPNGTYKFGVRPREHFAITPTLGNVTVNGHNVTINVTFIEVIFKVTFIADGLPNGTNWSISMNGQTNYTKSNNLSFEEFNGTYFYSIGLVPGYYTFPENGTVKVDGSDKTVMIYFSITMYLLTFNETGLPPQVLWYVNLSGMLRSSIGNSIIFNLPNGTYNFTVSNESGYLQSAPFGKIVVNGTNILYNITFGKIYEVIFLQEGLPKGSEWSVTFDGITKSTTTDRIFFEAVNGSYSYTITTTASDSQYKYTLGLIFISTNSNSQTIDINEPSNIVVSGQITVNGQSISKSLTFTKTGKKGPGLYTYATVIAAIVLIAAAVLYLFRKGRTRNED